MAKYKVVTNSENRVGCIVHSTSIWEFIKLAYYCIRYPDKYGFFVVLPSELAKKIFGTSEGLNNEPSSKNCATSAKILEFKRPN